MLVQLAGSRRAASSDRGNRLLRLKQVSPMQRMALCTADWGTPTATRAPSVAAQHSPIPALPVSSARCSTRPPPPSARSWPREIPG